MSGISVEPKGFRYLLRVRFSECDAQNVVFNARYGEYVDVALTEYLRFKLGGYDKLLKQGLDSQIVKQTTQWESSAKFDDVIACHVSTLKIGTTSYVIETDMRDYYTGRRFAVTESVYVLVDSKQFIKTSIPQNIREVLVHIDKQTLIDHAGVTGGKEL